MAIVRAENGRLIRQMAGELLVLEPWGENSLRVRATFNAELPTDDWALLPPQETPAVQIETVVPAASAAGISPRPSALAAIFIFSIKRANAFCGSNGATAENWTARDFMI